MSSVLLLKITKKGILIKRFSLNMPTIEIEIGASPASPAELPEVKVVNNSGEGILISFPVAASPCDPEVIRIASGGAPRSLAWKPAVGAGFYSFMVSQETESMVAGNVRPSNGTIDIAVVG
jgi:hypothetical protein